MGRQRYQRHIKVNLTRKRMLPGRMVGMERATKKQTKQQMNVQTRLWRWTTPWPGQIRAKPMTFHVEPVAGGVAKARRTEPSTEMLRMILHCLCQTMPTLSPSSMPRKRRPISRTGQVGRCVGPLRPTWRSQELKRVHKPLRDPLHRRLQTIRRYLRLKRSFLTFQAIYRAMRNWMMPSPKL